jgi:hypothetical protein
MSTTFVRTSVGRRRIDIGHALLGLYGLGFVGLLALPTSGASAQDSSTWQKPWENPQQPAAKPARAAPPPAPSGLGVTNTYEPAPNGAGGYGNSPASGDIAGQNGSGRDYGSSPSYGQSGSGSQGGQGSYGSQAQGYGGAPNQGYGSSSGQSQGAPATGYGAPSGRGNDAYTPPRSSSGDQGGYNAPYSAPAQNYEPEPAPAYDSQPGYGAPQQGSSRYGDEPTPGRASGGGYYSKNEISQAGHGFFGSVTRGLASAIEHTYQHAGRPNGYILGEDGGGAFIAGLRYGEGTLFTKDAGQHKVYWQGPSLGYDVGAEGSKTMVLVYNMRDVQDLYNRFGGIEGSAYLIGGVSVQFQKHGDVTLALIRSGVGLRLGANVGYLKYSQKPTWNPF